MIIFYFFLYSLTAHLLTSPLKKKSLHMASPPLVQCLSSLSLQRSVMDLMEAAEFANLFTKPQLQKVN